MKRSFRFHYRRNRYDWGYSLPVALVLALADWAHD